MTETLQILSAQQENIYKLEVEKDSSWAVVSGGFAFLLSIYLQSSTPSFYIRTTDPEQLSHVSIQVNPESHINEFITSIQELHLPHHGSLESFNTFWLCIDSPDFNPVPGVENSTVPLRILCSAKGSTLNLSLSHDASNNISSFGARFISQLAHVTQQLLVASDGERALRSLDFISDLDRRSLQQWNQTPPSYTSALVHDIITQRVAENPTSKAVHSWDGELTYAELDSLAANVSSYLLATGTRSGECIPLCFEKSLWVVVAMFGVLKSGCSFLLMDVSHPTSRLQMLSREVKATTILCSSSQADRATSLAPRAVIVSDVSQLVPGKNENFPVNVTPDMIAAIVFTSGTTGKPKGIAIEHQSICSSLLAFARLAGLNEGTRFFQFSSYAFDAAYGEILMTLFSGGCVCIPSDKHRLNHLAGSISFFNANTTLLTPSVLRLLSPSDIPCLKTLLTGGERVTHDVVEVWQGMVHLVIAYGPAECTVICIAKTHVSAGDSSSKIGFPVNCRAWITLLDDPEQLAPIGVVGELVIEGPGVARHYINNPTATTNSFLEIPPWKLFETLSGRCYRTGDCAQLTDDGEIIFAGRRDRQIKLHGQRIELEEIESRLRHHVQLPRAQIFVEVLELAQTCGSPSLVAFLHSSCSSDTETAKINHDMSDKMKEIGLEIERLQSHISQELPFYMLPTLWIPLAQVPLTSSGKLDRRELLKIGAKYSDDLEVFGEPHEDLSPMEAVLARIWRNILPFARKNLPPDAHFFRLGGDSLQAMALITQAKNEGFILNMEDILKDPTITGMAKKLQATPSSLISSPSDAPFWSFLSLEDSSPVWTELREYGWSRSDVIDILPCTPLQEGLFFVSMGLSSKYIGQFVFDLSSDVDIPRFEAAWKNAFSAFPILRSAIIPLSSGCMQVVTRLNWQWNKVKQELQSFLSAEIALGFRPGQTLARHSLIEDPLSGHTHFVLTLHHAVYDGWSLDTVAGYIRRAYSYGAPVTPTTASFAEFVRFTEKANGEKSRQFWKGQLQDAPAPSFPSTPKSGYLAADESCLCHHIAIPSASTLGLTPTIMARAAWALILAEYEGSDDVVFGNTLHGRNSLPPDLHDVVGPTITTLPIRVKVDRAQTVADFLIGLQEQSSIMVQHEQLGLPRIHAIDKHVKEAAAFRTLLIVQNADSETSEQDLFQMREIGRSIHEYPLVLTLKQGQSSIEIIATFDGNVISVPQVKRILGQFEQVYHELHTMSTDITVSALDLASKADKSTMFLWNARLHKAFEVCVHEMIQEHVKRSPNSPAIYSSQGILSYAAMDRISDGLVEELDRLGVKTGSTVGVLFEKSQWALISMLAIIKAGSAFAPLSPVHPQARLEDITREAHIRVVLCSALQKKRFPDPPWQAFVVDDGITRTSKHATKPVRAVAPETPLYLMSTSGTTGIPKIFAVQHRSFATGAIARAPLLRRGSSSRVLQFAPFNFDPSVEDILTTLMFGGCICVPSDKDVIGDLSGFMKTAQVNFANITPSVAHTLDPARLPDLEILLLSGEAPDQALVEKWAGKLQLMNGYGPSECSVKCSLNCDLSRHDPKNIGHSVGSSLWVVSPANHNRLTPLGAVGELLIESPNLAMGYFSGTKDTKAKFAISPPWLQDFRDGQETRVYKTGDLVKYLEDGSIVYIGRLDSQLKLHGQRFEAEEVTQRVQECLDDGEQTVLVDIAKFEGQDLDLLVAFVAPKLRSHTGEVKLDAILQRKLVDKRETIIRHLEKFLPKFMIPSVFLALSAMPLTQNGKADRRALKAQTQRLRLGPELLQMQDRPVQPLVSKEETLMHGLWQNLFGVGSKLFGANADFFELGGSSLSAIKLSATLRDLGYSLSAHDIFQDPILSSMADRMELFKMDSTPPPSRFSLLHTIDHNVHELWESLATYGIEEHQVEDAYPCTRMQNIYLEERISPSSGALSVRHIVPLPDNIDLFRLEKAVRRVVQANAFLRTRIIPLSSHVVQVVLKDDFIYRRVETLSTLDAEDRQASWGFGESMSRFSIVDGGKPQTRYLTWSCNHAIFDAWGRKLLLRDIDYAYHHHALPPARPQYHRFIKYVFELETKEIVSNFIKELRDGEFRNYFTLDATRIPRLSRFLKVEIDFPVALPSGLSYATMMITAWAICSAHIEEHRNLLFNTLLSGRDAAFPGVDQLMGPTSTRAPLAIMISKELSVRRQVALVQKKLGDAALMQHFPDLGEEWRQRQAYVPNIVVHPAEDYEDEPTQYLKLVRSQVEVVQEAANPMFMNFNLRDRNTGVDLHLEIDPAYFPEDKAVRYLRLLSHVLMRIFEPGGIDLKVDEIALGFNVQADHPSIQGVSFPTESDIQENAET